MKGRSAVAAILVGATLYLLTGCSGEPDLTGEGSPAPVAPARSPTVQQPSPAGPTSAPPPPTSATSSPAVTPTSEAPGVVAFLKNNCWGCGSPGWGELYLADTSSVSSQRLALPWDGVSLHGWSADGSSLIVSVFEDEGRNVELYKLPLLAGPSGWTAGNPERLTSTPGSEEFALVSPASGYIAVHLVPAGCLPYNPEILPGCEGQPRILDAHGRLLLELPADVFPYAWSPDGTLLLVGRRTTGGEFPGIHELQLVHTASGDARLVWRDDALAMSSSPAFSPDGAHVAIPVTESPLSAGGELLQVVDVADGSRVNFVADGFAIHYPAWKDADEVWAIGFDHKRLAQELLLGSLPGGGDAEVAMAVQRTPTKVAETQFAWAAGGEWLAVSLYSLAPGDTRELPVLHLSSDGASYDLVGVGPDVRIHWRPEPSAGSR
jgi:hypothetical protein